MPLITLTGVLCSGKSTVAEKLATFFKDIEGKQVCVVSEDNILEEKGWTKSDVFDDSKKEKDLGCMMRSEVAKSLSADVVVISDGSNYTKSIRYELFCIVKSARTLHCVVQCCNTLESTKYTKDTLDKAVRRYETPNPQARWDSPLFIIHNSEIPFKEIKTALYDNKALKPNLSTRAQPLLETNTLYHIHEITEGVCRTILASKTSGYEGEITIPGSTEVYLMDEEQVSTLPQLRQQFINYAKTKFELNDIATAFVKYLNSIKNK